MSNLQAQRDCEQLIISLDDCRSRGFLAKVRGDCFELERLVRLCRHEARMEDSRRHVEAARERRRKLEEVWKRDD